MNITDEQAKAQAANTSIFRMLNGPAVLMRASDTINNFVRSRLLLPFTKQPRRGMVARLFYSSTLLSVRDWLAMGLSPDELSHEVMPPPVSDGPEKVMPVTREPGSLLPDDVTSPVWDTGELFYEIVENRLRREDAARRLEVRKVGRVEWAGYAAGQRVPAHEPAAYRIMGELLGQIMTLAESKQHTEPGETPA